MFSAFLPQVNGKTYDIIIRVSNAAGESVYYTGQGVADTPEKTLRVHTVFLLALLVVLCWYVSSRTRDTHRGAYPQNSCLLGSEW